ncbi:MAG: hypothetical protein AMXMBFR77_27960 [Phycisphaerales bacterium]
MKWWRWVALSMAAANLACDTAEGTAWTPQTESWIDTECEHQPPCPDADWIKRPQILGRPDLGKSMNSVCYWKCPTTRWSGCDSITCDPDAKKSVKYLFRVYERSTTTCEPWVDPLPDFRALPICDTATPSYPPPVVTP